MHDLIIVGGGIAGSSLALVMARQGASVLVLEREPRFRDRIRGEAIHVWGTVDAKALGLYDLLLDRCAHELPFITRYRDEAVVVHRDLAQTTPSGGRELTFFHPAMQETLIDAARDAGATVCRNALVTAVSAGNPPMVRVQHDGEEHERPARLVVGADGRRSKVRTWAGFATQRDPNNLFIAGVLVSGLPASDDALHVFSRPDAAWNTQFFALGSGQYRCYFVSGDRRRHRAIGGTTGVAKLYEYAHDSRVPDSWLETMRVEGPLASFEGASWWVDTPYRAGVVLIGDAAAAPDPCFGSGLSMALRDVRLLRDCLLADADWDHAARRYAAAHDTTFAALHTLERWAAEGWYSADPERQAIREHADAASEGEDAPDLIGRGPDQPADESARCRFLGY
jgi:2-polyprenyl-6-methoxyphenol hydroxylase-like FAD-dependent oxidoreductase